MKSYPSLRCGRFTGRRFGSQLSFQFISLGEVILFYSDGALGSRDYRNSVDIPGEKQEMSQIISVGEVVRH